MPGGEAKGFAAIATKFCLTGTSSMMAEGATCARRPAHARTAAPAARRPGSAARASAYPPARGARR